MSENKMVQASIKKYTAKEQTPLVDPPPRPALPLVECTTKLDEATPSWALTMCEYLRTSITGDIRKDLNKVNDRIDDQETRIKALNTKTNDIEEGMNVFNANFETFDTRLKALEHNTNRTCDLTNAQEVRGRTADYEKLQKEVKLMGIALDHINSNKDYISNDELLRYLDHHLRPNSFFLDKVLDVKQLGKGKVTTTDLSLIHI